jgi:PAT family beta-lactamase induction signal transducer AmpG
MGWSAAYIACAALALPAMLTALVMGEPARHREPAERKGLARTVGFDRRAIRRILPAQAARHWCCCFILVHKIGDTLAKPDVPAAVRRSWLQQRRDRRLGRGVWASGPI